MKITQLPPLGRGQYRYAQNSFEVEPTNCYIIESEAKNAAITDAPCSVDFIVRTLAEKGLTLKKILITHGHFEHIFAIRELVEKTGAEVYIHSADKAALTDNDRNFINYVRALDYKPYEGEVNTIGDGDIIHLDEVEIKVLHTPGHSPGCVCYLTGNALFSGDVLSHNAVGHHEIPYANRTDMLNSLKKIYALDKAYDVYPAHWTTTALDYEKAGNLNSLPIVMVSGMIKL
jgi:glyoxylase-like metal-dependent hydrolase (beta-lactamase superfamily II)